MAARNDLTEDPAIPLLNKEATKRQMVPSDAGNGVTPNSVQNFE